MIITFFVRQNNAQSQAVIQYNHFCLFLQKKITKKLFNQFKLYTNIKSELYAKVNRKHSNVDSTEAL